MPKRLLEAPTQQERATQRRNLGTLKDLTVQPATKQRYNKAIDGFLTFLKQNRLVLPHAPCDLDPLLCEYLEYLWAHGFGRALASDTVAGLQDFDVRFRGSLQGAWRLLKTWSVNEVPNRAPPLPQHVVRAMVGWALFHHHVGFAVSLLVGFYGMLRTGEILALHASHVHLDSHQAKAVISLGLTKSGKRQGAAESIVLGLDTAIWFLQRWKSLASSTTPLAKNPAHWRGLFVQAVTALGLTDWGFRPYSLRRGGATWWFARHHSLDRILLQGRWSAPKTAKIYLNEGLAVMAEMRLPETLPSLRPFLQLFAKYRNRFTFTTLEPTAKAASSGARGEKSMKTPKKASKKKASKQTLKSHQKRKGLSRPPSR